MVFNNGNLSARPQAVLFDLDDTLITDGGLSEKAWKEACREYTERTGTIGEDELYRTIKQVADSYWNDPEKHRRGRLDLNLARREVVRQAFSDLGLQDGGDADRLADDFSTRKDRAISLVPGAISILESLKKSGIPLALLTNGGPDSQRSKIERFKLAPYFACILIEGEFGSGKPDEIVFRTALEKLGASAAASWMVGDDLERDIAGAGRLGINTVWVDWREKGLPQGAGIKPDCVITRLDRLMQCFG